MAQKLPLMPTATAVWLIDNSTLTFAQIGVFCGLHELEVQAIADGDAHAGMTGVDPIANGQITREALEASQEDPNLPLKLAQLDLPEVRARGKGPRYTPVSKRGDKPNAIAWLLKTCPEIKDAQICRLIGTTKPTIKAIRDKTHWNMTNLKPESPVVLGLCSQMEMDAELDKLPRQQAATDEDISAES